MTDNPDTATRIELPYLAAIKRNDPTFLRDRINEPEYEFSRRVFRANPNERGAYGTVTGPDSIFQETTPDIEAVEDLFQEP